MLLGGIDIEAVVGLAVHLFNSNKHRAAVDLDVLTSLAIQTAGSFTDSGVEEQQEYASGAAEGWRVVVCNFVRHPTDASYYEALTGLEWPADAPRPTPLVASPTLTTEWGEILGEDLLRGLKRRQYGHGSEDAKRYKPADRQATVMKEQTMAPPKLDAMHLDRA